MSISNRLGLIVMACLFFLPKKNRARYRTGNMKPDKELFRRLFKFGGPNGVQLFLDLAAFNAFVILLGKIGTTEMNSSGVAFSLNSLAMIPMFGLGQTVSILVGQGVGGNDIPYAERAVKSARFWLYLMMNWLPSWIRHVWIWLSRLLLKRLSFRQNWSDLTHFVFPLSYDLFFYN